MNCSHWSLPIHLSYACAVPFLCPPNPMLLFIGLCPRQGSGSKGSLQRPRSARLVPGKPSRSKLIIQWAERLHACGRERLSERVCG